jgi:hypothetical protein
MINRIITDLELLCNSSFVLTCPSTFRRVCVIRGYVFFQIILFSTKCSTWKLFKYRSMEFWIFASDNSKIGNWCNWQFGARLKVALRLNIIIYVNGRRNNAAIRLQQHSIVERFLCKSSERPIIGKGSDAPFGLGHYERSEAICMQMVHSFIRTAALRSQWPMAGKSFAGIQIIGRSQRLCWEGFLLLYKNRSQRGGMTACSELISEQLSVYSSTSLLRDSFAKARNNP